MTIRSTATRRNTPATTSPRSPNIPDGQTAPTPSKIDFKPGELLGSVSGELGLRKFLEDAGHTLVVTSSKDGKDSVLDKELPDAEIVISQPFWPAYMTKERIEKAKKLKLIITAGIGSDHTDLQAAMDKGVTVAEVTYCNSISVSEHIVMMILALVRNYIPSYGWVVRGGWNIADCVERSYDLEGMNVGTVAAGRIGLAALRRLKPFDVKLHYYRQAPAAEGSRKGAWAYLPSQCRVAGQGLRRGHHQHAAASRDRAHVQRQADRHDEARLLYREHRARQDLSTATPSSARWKAASSRAMPAMCGSRSRAPSDHPWRTMPHHGMTPHISGTSLSAQARYAAGTREILESYFAKKPIRTEYLIVDKGKLAGAGAHSYTAGDATKGSEEAAKFKKQPAKV